MHTLSFVVVSRDDPSGGGGFLRFELGASASACGAFRRLETLLPRSSDILDPDAELLESES